MRWRALQYRVSPAFACRMHALWRETGAVQGKFWRLQTLAAGTVCSGHQGAAIEQLVDDADGTAELAGHEQNLSVSISAIGKFIRRKLGYRYKKTLVTSEPQREDVVKGGHWQAWQQTCDLSKRVFLDEAGVTTNMIRRYGRALGGARCRDAAPAGHWQTLAFIAGLRADGLTAPWWVDQAMTGEPSRNICARNGDRL